MTNQAPLLSNTKGNPGKTERRIKNSWNHQIFRRISQLGFAGFILFLVAQHIIIGEDGATIIPSAEAFCPFGGLETLYKYVTEGGSFVSHTHLSNVVLLIAVLVVAFLFRSAFCGWICPLGSLQDLIYSFSKFLQKKIPGLRKGINSLKKKTTWASVIDRYLRYVKYLVLIWAVGGSAYFGYMVFRDFDPWSALLNIAEFSFTPGFVILIITIVASFFVERPWCRYACPLGAVSGLAGKFSPTYLKRNENACTNCKICTRSCPMGLEIHSADTIKGADCVSCLECVGVCPQKGALEVKFGLPFIGK